MFHLYSRIDSQDYSIPKMSPLLNVKNGNNGIAGQLQYGTVSSFFIYYN